MAWREGRTGTILRRVGTARDPARGGSTPAESRYLGLREPTPVLKVRAKILLLLAVGAARLQSHCECRDEGWAASAYAKLEQAAAVRMVARGCACGRAVGRCRARGARMQPSTIATSLKSTGTEDARNTCFGHFGRELGFFNSHFLGKPLLGVV